MDRDASVLKSGETSGAGGTIAASTVTSGRRSCPSLFRLPDEFLKKSPVMNHRLAQFFGARSSQCLARRDCVSSPVIFRHQWMIHGNVRCTLLEIADRIASRQHHVAQ